MKRRQTQWAVLALGLALPVVSRAAELVTADNPDPRRLPTLSVYNDDKFSHGKVLTMVAATFPNVPDFTCDSWCYESAVDFYEHPGYAVIGPGPILFDEIIHSKMEKRL